MLRLLPRRYTAHRAILVHLLAVIVARHDPPHRPTPRRVAHTLLAGRLLRRQLGQRADLGLQLAHLHVLAADLAL